MCLRKLPRLICLTLAVLAALSVSLAEEIPAPKYEALSRTAFNLRAEPDENARRIGLVERADGPFDILEYAEDWCLMVFDKDRVGYAKTEWLYCFRSLDPSVAPNLSFVDITGVATVTKEAIAAVEEYSGNTFAVGDRLAVSETINGLVLFPMMRGTGIIAEDSATVTPLAPIESAKVGDTVAAFTTFYNEKTGGRLAEGRAYNIALGCERLNGVVLDVGEAFSFNKQCGPYRKSKGYVMAPNISEDGEGYGGGVCQVSTTLYNALLDTPIKITRSRFHRAAGVPYVPVGFDSAVGSYTDLEFVNTLPYPIKIEAMPQNGVVTVFLRRAPEAVASASAPIE